MRGSGSAVGVSPPRRVVYGESFTSWSQPVRNISYINLRSRRDCDAEHLRGYLKVGGGAAGRNLL